jgi:hypothetical protein
MAQPMPVCCDCTAYAYAISIMRAGNATLVQQAFVSTAEKKQLQVNPDWSASLMIL